MSSPLKDDYLATQKLIWTFTLLPESRRVDNHDSEP